MRTILGNRPAQFRSSQAATWLLVLLVALMVIYAGAHWLFPPAEAGAFFWSVPPAQWFEWLFWCLAGTLIDILSQHMGGVARLKRGSLPSARNLFEILRSFVFALCLIFALVYLLELDLASLKLNLKESPALAAALAFVLGFYARLTDRLFFKLLLQLLIRLLERLLGRSIGRRSDDEAYIQLHVDPRLQPAYRRAIGTPTGKSGHESSRDKRARYKISKIVSQAGFTVNALKTVYVADDLMRSASEETIVEIVAHEASHIAQADLSDSVNQEVTAYMVGAKVIGELTPPGQPLGTGIKEWISLNKQIAADQPDDERKSLARKTAQRKVRDMKIYAPLYGIIPTEQKKKLKDVLEFIRQAAFLGADMLGLGHWFSQQD